MKSLQDLHEALPGRAGEGEPTKGHVGKQPLPTSARVLLSQPSCTGLPRGSPAAKPLLGAHPRLDFTRLHVALLRRPALSLDISSSLVGNIQGNFVQSYRIYPGATVPPTRIEVIRNRPHSYRGLGGAISIDVGRTRSAEPGAQTL